MLTPQRRLLALGLFDIGAIQFGRFKLKLHDKHPDAPLSPIYIDLRLLRSFPDVMDSAVRVYVEMTNSLNFDVYADVPTASTPIVAVMSHETRVPMISPRIDAKQHGLGRQIDGRFDEGQVALLVDDLITLADSKINAISILEQNGLVVRDVAVLMDREQGGVRELESRGYSCHVAFRLTELVELFLEEQKITREQFDQTTKYLHPA